jgi:hypothetical protein
MDTVCHRLRGEGEGSFANGPGTCGGNEQGRAPGSCEAARPQGQHEIGGSHLPPSGQGGVQQQQHQQRRGRSSERSWGKWTGTGGGDQPSSVARQSWRGSCDGCRDGHIILSGGEIAFSSSRPCLPEASGQGGKSDFYSISHYWHCPNRSAARHRRLCHLRIAATWRALALRDSPSSAMRPSAPFARCFQTAASDQLSKSASPASSRCENASIFCNCVSGHPVIYAAKVGTHSAFRTFIQP